MTHKTKATMPGRLCNYTKLKNIQHNTLIDQVNGLIQSVSDGLSCRACLRCRRLISPCMAATINCPVLSPFSFKCSMPSITSCGMRAVTDCDLVFFGPVAISTPLVYWCKTIYTIFYLLKDLTCKTPWLYRVSYTLICSRLKIAKPGSAVTLTGPLTTTLIEVTIMADTQSTQTRPKYHFRFLAIARINPAATPCRLSVEAATEQEARLSLVRLYILSLAARLPVQEVAHA
jgi:hypothetical protein